MARSFSLSARESFNSPATGDTPIVLVVLSHDDMEEPARLASDYTEKLSDDPLALGVKSGGAKYLFVMMTAIWPDDQDGAPPTTEIVFNVVADDMVAVARSIRTQATLDMFLVMASDPDVIEQQFTGLKVVKSSYNSEQLTLTVTRVDITSEPYPAELTSRSRFPGMHQR